MRFKRFRKMCLTLSILLGSVAMSSCSAFFGSDELTISSTDVKTDENGNTIVTITFTDENKSPLTFTIPNAIDGEDGVGIATVTSELSEDKTLVTIIITYTDANREPTVITVPVYKGEDGKEITNIIQDFDENGNTTLVFEYSDNTQSDVITINKGEDGKGISDIVINSDEHGNYELIIKYTDDTTESPIYISSGVGISSVVYNEEKSDESNYCLTITYSNGETEDIFVPAPISTKWLSGNGYPSNDLGNEGDFYVIESSGAVYKKTAGTWRYLFSIKGIGSDLTYKVTFNLSGGKWTNGDLTNPEESSTEIRTIDGLTYGSYIDLNQDYLKCYNEDDSLEFMGWWTDATINANSGHFTNLSAVTKDLILYAIWG